VPVVKARKVALSMVEERTTSGVSRALQVVVRDQMEAGVKLQVVAKCQMGVAKALQAVARYQMGEEEDRLVVGKC